MADMRRIPVYAVAVLSLAAGPASAQNDGAEFFEKNVRPLLAPHCLACHSVASRPVMGGLRLDHREALEKGGSRGPAIVSGKPEQSLLIRAVRQMDERLRMPPTGKLKDSEIAILIQWVERGAPWGTETTQPHGQPQRFWSFVAPQEPRIPEVRNKAGVKSPIDAFLLAALEAKRLTPAPPADKRTLIRRA